MDAEGGGINGKLGGREERGMQGCRIVLGAWQQKICAWQKIA